MTISKYIDGKHIMRACNTVMITLRSLLLLLYKYRFYMTNILLQFNKPSLFLLKI